MKTCNICNIEKECSSFRTSTQSSDGYERMCTTCRRPQKKTAKLEKTCCKCEKVLQIENFTWSNKKRGWRGSFCRDCHNSLRSKKDFLLTVEQRKNRHLKRRFKINLQEFNNMLLKQENKCKICKEVEHSNEKPLSVDHNHKTNQVRGLLCNNCNTGIGHLKENTIILREAINYLEEYTQKAI